MANEKDDYIPFGEEWEKEIMKMPKKYIIGMYRANCIRNKEIISALTKISHFSDCGNESLAISKMKLIASQAI